MNGSTKIAFADRNECVLLGVQSLLRSSGLNLEVAGFARDEKELLHVAATSSPEILVADILPVLGIEGLKKFIEKFQHIMIIAYTSSKKQFIIYQLVSLGIKACVFQYGSAEELLIAIQSVAEGENYYCPLTEEKLDEFNKEGVKLSEHYLQVLHYLYLGKSDQEIGQLLYKSPRTIEHNREALQQKFGVKSKLELINAAVAKGYIIRIFTGFMIQLSLCDENLLTLIS